jgi:ABC-type multidrug transport system ATPase subunit
LLDGIDLTLAEGAIFTLFGPNGAGEATIATCRATGRSGRSLPCRVAGRAGRKLIACGRDRP